MKNYQQPYLLYSIFCFFLFNTNAFGQYTETFLVNQKGVLMGACGATAQSCAMNDFTGVDWDLVGDFSGLDAGDYLKTNATGVLEYFGDIDGEICFESPLLDISGVAGSFSIEADLVWVNHDNPDWIDIEYSIDGALPYVQVPNQFNNGTVGTHTIHDGNNFSSNWSSSGTVIQSGLTGTNTLSVRVCVVSNTSSENTTLSEVRVPEAGAMVLPVELISFKAEKSEELVKLDWLTATETNNEKFVIEYSTSGIEFENIGEIGGRGTSIELVHYSFEHKNPTSGQNYYRLKQVDFDGKYQYSQIESIYIISNEERIGEFYPNPTKNGIVNLDYYALSSSNIEFNIYNLTGYYLSSQTFTVHKGANKLNFDLTNLTKGVYLIEVKNKSAYFWRKLVIN